MLTAREGYTATLARGVMVVVNTEVGSIHFIYNTCICSGYV